MRFTISAFLELASDGSKHGAAVFVGLVSMGVWVNLVGYGGVFLEPALTDSSFEMTRYAYHAGRVSVSLLFVFAPMLFERFGRIARTYLPLLMCFCTFGFAVSFYQTLVPSVYLGVTASFVLGVGYLWIAASFYIALARTASMRTVIFVALLSQITEQMVSVVANSVLGFAAQIAVCCLCPLVALAALSRAWREREGVCRSEGISHAAKSSGPSSPPTRCCRSEGISHAAKSHLYLLIAASGVAIVTLSAMSNVGIWGSVRVDYGAENPLASFLRTCFACVLLVALTWGTLIASAERPLGYRYQVPFLIIVGCFMLAVLKPLFPGCCAEPFAVVLLSAEFFSHVLSWVLVMNAEKDLDMPAYFNVGMSLVPYSVFSIGWIFLLETEHTPIALVVLAVSYALVIVVAVHPRLLYERRKRSLISTDDLNEYTIEGEPVIPLESSGAAVADVIDRRCAWLGVRYKLSQRESQVLALLAQGRSCPAIQRELVLSEGTVKTHIAHIYEKMNVGSRQEVFDIVYDVGESAMSKKDTAATSSS